MVLTGRAEPGFLRPVSQIALGLVFTFGALRINGFDLLLDPIGWGFCAAGLVRLRESDDDHFGWARTAAGVMAGISLLRLIVSAVVSDSSLGISPVKLVIGAVDGVGALIVVWLVVDAIVRRISAQGERSRAALLDVSRWAVVGLGALGLLGGERYADLAVVVAGGWLVAIVTLIVVLFASARLPGLS